MNTYTQMHTQTMTNTDAINVAAKIAADLVRIRDHGRMDIPVWQDIYDYQKEAIMLLQAGCLDEVTYGFQKNNVWVLAIKYKAQYGRGGAYLIDDDPGEIRWCDVVGSHFLSFLKYSNTWRQLSIPARQSYENQLPFIRAGGVEPGGDWGEYDKDYASGNIGVKRKTIT